MNSKRKIQKMNDEQRYLDALVKIRALLFNVIEDFDEGDDEVSHFLENIYDVLDEVVPM